MFLDVLVKLFCSVHFQQCKFIVLNPTGQGPFLPTWRRGWGGCLGTVFVHPPTYKLEV
jgi:hypothetical protein